jgi:hypothetical protein
LAASDCSPDSSAIAARDQVFELPATDAIEAHSTKSPSRITTPVSNLLSVSRGAAEVLNHIAPETSANLSSLHPAFPPFPDIQRSTVPIRTQVREKHHSPVGVDIFI